MKFNSAIIRYTKEKFKSFLADDTIYIALLLGLVGFGSFGLGRLSVAGGEVVSHEGTERVQLIASSTPPTPASSTISIQNGAAVVTALTPVGGVTGPYVASKSGTKYYLTSCSGAKRLKEENKVFFATAQEAMASGYEPATTCPGL